MKTKTLTLAGSAIIAILLITTGVALITNSRNKRNFNEEKVQNLSLVSQKMQVVNDLDKAKSDLVALTSKEEKVNKSLADAEARLALDGRKLTHLSIENASLVKDRNELVQLQKSKRDLDNAYSDLKLEYQTALSRVKNLENSEILLDAEKTDLISKLQTSEKDRIDNVELYGSRGNRADKLTFVARRTRKLNINFDSPLGKSDQINYKIITPSGTIINPEDKSSAWVVIDHSKQDMTASLSSVSAEPEISRKLELRDNSKSKLKPGEYTIQFFSNNKNIGNYKLKLR